MVTYSMAIPSSTSNTVLAVILEIFIVILGQNLYEHWVNNYHRVQLISAGSTRLYDKNGLKYSFYVSIALIFIASESIELGFYGQTGEKIFRNLQPAINFSQSSISDWARDERLSKNPGDMQLSDFRASMQRERCIRHQRRGSIQFIDFYAYGKGGCFDTISYTDQTSYVDDRFEDSNLKAASVAVGTDDFQVRFLHEIDHGAKEFGRVQFTDFEQTSVTFEVELGRNGNRYGDHFFATFSLLQNWEYGSADDSFRGNEKIAMVLWTNSCSEGIPQSHLNDEECECNPFSSNTHFQVISFSDVFVTPWRSNSTIPKPKYKAYDVSVFRIHTFFIQNLEPPSRGLCSEIPIVAAHKVFYGLSKLHFALEPNSNNSSSFSAHLVSEMDRPLLNNNEEALLRVAMHRNGQFQYPRVVTRIVPYAFFEFISVLVILAFLKLIFILKNTLSPFSVNVFDARYISAVKAGDRAMLRKYSKEGYNVFMVQDEEGRYELKLEVVEEN